MKISAGVVFAALLSTFVLCVGMWILEVRSKFLRRFYDEIMLDNRNHYLSCQQLPTEADIRQVMEEHQDAIKSINQINPGFIGMEIDSSACPGKADILFWYGTHQDRLRLEAILAGKTFYGVPYRLQNR